MKGLSTVSVCLDGAPGMETLLVMKRKKQLSLVNLLIYPSKRQSWQKAPATHGPFKGN